MATMIRRDRRRTLMTAADMRAEIGRRRLVKHRLAAELGIHPTYLGMLLNEKLDMPDEIAERLSRLLSPRALAGTPQDAA
jgi:hypothetical protein